MTLELASLSQNERNALLALLKLLARDLSEGYVPLGFGTRRGLGEVEAEPPVYSPCLPVDDGLQAAWDAFLEEPHRFGEKEGQRDE